ncbi:hypothetical protein [Burkholderia sp. MBR-1]|uniref:hypothetical protein n=1 Tax=Burkholderia sp. MBR-1 TaxID=2732364 RepID=UPI0015EEB073|nr:hypothetical protein [Burkholderia sp. MBR-1]QMI49736.1 hypothetical protein MBR110_30135 [Burkholderia sp. MBR-1]
MNSDTHVDCQVLISRLTPVGRESIHLRLLVDKTNAAISRDAILPDGTKLSVIAPMSEITAVMDFADSDRYRTHLQEAYEAIELRFAQILATK